MLGNHPHAIKASIIHKPDTPWLHEAISGEHQDDILAAMGKYIEELEKRNTCKVVKKNSLPRGSKLLPSSWAFKIK